MHFYRSAGVPISTLARLLSLPVFSLVYFAHDPAPSAAVQVLLALAAAGIPFFQATHKLIGKDASLFYAHFIQRADSHWPYFAAYPDTLFAPEVLLEEVSPLGRLTKILEPARRQTVFLRQVDARGEPCPRVAGLRAYQLRLSRSILSETFVVISEDPTRASPRTKFNCLHEIHHSSFLSVLLREGRIYRNSSACILLLWALLYLRWETLTLVYVIVLVPLIRILWSMQSLATEGRLEDETASDCWAINGHTIDQLRELKTHVDRYIEAGRPFFEDPDFESVDDARKANMRRTEQLSSFVQARIASGGYVTPHGVWAAAPWVVAASVAILSCIYRLAVLPHTAWSGPQK